MKQLFSLTLAILVVFPTMAQKQSSDSELNSLGYSLWKNKSPLGITVSYDHKRYDLGDQAAVNMITNYLPHRDNNFPFDTKIDVATDYLKNNDKIKSSFILKSHNINTVRLQVDYWLLPFLNVYGLGGKTYSQFKTNYTLSIADDLYKPISIDTRSDGWEYGFGVKTEYFYKGFKPQVGYSMYWTHLDEINDKTRCQELNLKLGHTFNFQRTWVKNLTLYAGATYNYMKLKNGYALSLGPSKKTLQNEDDFLIFILYSAQKNGINVKHQGGYIVYATEKDRDNFAQFVENHKNGFPEVSDFPMFNITLPNIHEWNINAGIELEVYRDFFWRFDAKFISTQTSLSTSISYRLFGKK